MHPTFNVVVAAIGLLCMTTRPSAVFALGLALNIALILLNLVVGG